MLNLLLCFGLICKRSFFDDSGNHAIIKFTFLWQSIPVLCIPARVMSGIHYPLTAHGFMLFPFIIYGYGMCFIITE